MKSLRRCTTLVLAALIVRTAARVPCGAHQNVDPGDPSAQMTSRPVIFPYHLPYSIQPFNFPPALLQHHVPGGSFLALEQGMGAGSTQPNVITQSVTWTPTKKSGKQSTQVETESPIDDLLIEVPERNMKLVRTGGQFKREMEYDLDDKLRRLVELLDGMTARESCRRRSCRMKRKRYQYDTPEESIEDYDDDPPSYYEPERKKRHRAPRYPKPYEELELDETEPHRKRFPMVPKMDWVVLKKSPKRFQRRWKEEDDRENDSQEAAPPRDVLYIPQSEPSGRYRKRLSCED